MISNFLYLSFSTLYSSSLWRTDTVVFAKWNKLPLLNKPPPPASIETPSNHGAYWRIHDIQVDNALYINRDTVSSAYDAMHDGAIMVSVHSLTQDSQMFQAGREQVKTCFFFKFIRPGFWTDLNSCRQWLLFARHLIPRKSSLYSQCIRNVTGTTQATNE